MSTSTFQDESINILVVGDSNSDVWKILRKDLNEVYPTKLIIQRVSGTSAQGLCKMKNSTLQSGHRILRILQDRSDYEWLIICAGSVDLDFIYYSKASKSLKENNEPVSMIDEAEYCIEKYFCFIDDVVLKTFKRNDRIVIQALHPPTLNDERNKSRLNRPKDLGRLGDSILYLDGECDPRILRTHKERTEAFLYFNKRIHEECKKRDIHVIDISDHLIDSDTGVIKDEFVRSSPHDVHIYEQNAAHFYFEAFSKLEPRYKKKS